MLRTVQNRPNPYKEETTIAFVLPKAGPTQLLITDISGRQIRLIEQYYEAGYHEVNIDKAMLGVSGVLMYQLSTSDNHAVRKMVVLE